MLLRVPAARVYLGALILLVSAVANPIPQETAQSPSTTEGARFKTASSGVVVDVVARDRNHRPISGLRASDFEVYENGIRQTITAFDEVGGADTGLRDDGPDGDTTRRDSEVTGVPGVVALVFEQLSPSGARRAEVAAQEFLETSLAPSDYAAIFHLDRALQVVESYSTDRHILMNGVRSATHRPGYSLQTAGAVPGAEFEGAEPGQPSRSTHDDSPFARGHATLDGIQQLIASLEDIPGRKAVLLFSEGLALMPAQDKTLLGGTSPDPDSWLSDNRRDHFFRVVEHANRAHVAFYTFDAGGLRIESPNVQGLCFGCAPEVGLKVLANETGGTYVHSTNDLRPGGRRVADDLSHYYLLGYTSTDSAVDDDLRRIEVKTRHPNVRLLSRKGYVPRRRSTAPPIGPEEIGPLLALTNHATPANAFPVFAGVLKIRPFRDQRG